MKNYWKWIPFSLFALALIIELLPWSISYITIDRDYHETVHYSSYIQETIFLSQSNTHLLTFGFTVLALLPSLLFFFVKRKTVCAVILFFGFWAITNAVKTVLVYTNYAFGIPVVLLLCLAEIGHLFFPLSQTSQDCG